ncbi:MAG: hypothetical protein LBD94_01790, partial [Rickettsiales bacterium]|nr:hypothetical protein [Rickettsiales bacterium]
MKKIKLYFSELKKNMPRHTQWVLLGIALVLTIMIILLLTDNKKISQTEQKKGEVALTVDPAGVDFGTVFIGESKEEKITVSTNMPAVVSNIQLSSDVQGLSLTETCRNMGKITEKLPCEIILTWKPTSETMDGKNVLNIKYHDAAGSKDIEKLEAVNILFVSKNAAVQEQPKKEPKNEEPVEEEPIKIVAEEPIPIVEEEPFFDDEPVAEAEPEPIVEEKKVGDKKEFNPIILDEPKIDDYVATSEECYQFAFAGYNNSGKQIGWIKPAGGHYMFHPFSDKTCSEPTGEYNQKTGFIMALKDPSKKIGSDSEHIGGRGAGANLTMPVLSNDIPKREFVRAPSATGSPAEGDRDQVFPPPEPQSVQVPSSFDKQATVSSRPYDRTFVLRHFKPIPATIVNEIRAVESRFILPVQATVDRHVYSDNGRTIIVPAGTLMLGSVVGDMPGPYKTIGRVNIEWYRFVRPDGVEFNFTTDEKPFSGDSQGRIGVPGHGSSDYLEQMVMPLLTAIVPAATNLIAPISDKIVNQIDLDNNVVVQSGTMRSSEMAKQEMIKSWNKVTEKLFIDMMDNTKPPFSIAAGTRITVYSPTDLIVAWCDG